jgi:hypothetical protein
MTATVLIEAEHAATFVLSEGFNKFSRDQVTVAASQTLVAGQVVGKIGVPSLETVSVAADAGNTGNGAFTLDGAAPVASGAIDGNYRVVCIAVATNSGQFTVTDPKGVELGRVAVGATFNNQIKFVVADGATDFVAGDAFTVTVGRESGTDEQIAAWSATATDGSQRAAGLMIGPVSTGAGQTAQTVMLARHAAVRLSDLTFGGSPTTAQQAEAIEQLRALGIICL